MSELSRYAGMTANERLYDAGLLGDFEAAARRRDRVALIRLLAQVDMEDAGSAADTILQTPERYGF